MTASSYWRGHPIYWDGKCWRYKATGQETVGNERPCGACGLDRTPEGHDGCLGTLPGVANACCGHGNASEAYVQFDDGTDVRGFMAQAAIAAMIRMRNESEGIATCEVYFSNENASQNVGPSGV